MADTDLQVCVEQIQDTTINRFSLWSLQMNLTIGSIAPEIKATNCFGELIKLSSLRKNNAVVVVFLRGFS